MKRPMKMTLPPEVIADLHQARWNPDWRHVFRVYLGALIRAGWRMSSIAVALKLTRQRIEQLVILEDYVEQSVEEYRFITGLALPLPAAPVIPERSGKRGMKARLPRPQTVDRLRGLHAEAKRYRGGPANREAAQMFTALVWYAHVSEGASIHGIAASLGIMPAALQSRLVRYGYKVSEGKSKPYRRLIGRTPSSGFARLTHCKRGHPLDGDNLRVVRTTGARACKACEQIRYRKYRARKKAALLGGES